MADNAERLLARRAELEQEAESLEDEIARRTADGEPAGRLSGLRERRRDAIDEASDVGDALAVLDERASDEAGRRRAEELRAARAEARSEASGFVEAAARVDGALEALEGAFDDMRLRSLDLARALRLAELSDSGRIAASLGPSLRWATWRGAPGYAKAAEVPRAPATRRESMAALAGRVVPRLPEA